MLEAGISWLASVGFRVRRGVTAVAGEGLHAGSPEGRAADLHSLLLDPDVDAVLATRGGSGTLALLPLVDFALAARAHKPLIGWSDLTALHLALWHRAGVAGIAGQVAVQLGPDLPAWSRKRWLACVRHSDSTGPIPLPDGVTLTTLAPGHATGRLFPCNVSLLVSLLGTPWMPPLDGAILLLEEIQETPQSLDRMVSRLRLTGADRGLAGVVLGQFTGCGPRNPGSVTEEHGREVVHDWVRSLGVPALGGFPHGHETLAAALPFAGVARIETDPAGLHLITDV
jgi:muramoyltetrapeptide carboxypeptidase